MQRRPALQSALAAMLALPAAARAKVTTPADLAMMAPGEVVQTLLDALVSAHRSEAAVRAAGSRGDRLAFQSR